MGFGESRKYSIYTDKLLDRVRKAYDAGSVHRMLRIRKELVKSRDLDNMVTIGIAFAYGRELPQDHEQALQWYRLAADNGSADGQFLYGRMLDTDENESDEVEQESPFYWYLQAAVGGCREAMFILACAYFTGNGAENSPQEGLRWKQKADMKEYEIHELVEDTYICGSDAMIRRIREAFPYVGDVVGATMIGDAISNEIIRGQDHAEAVAWYRTGVSMAVPGEQCLIAKQLEDGSGTTADLEEAVRTFQIAASNGNTESMRLLGLLGDEEEYPEGKKAPVRTNEEIYRRAQEAFSEGDKKTAVRIAMGLALSGMPEAQNLVGDIYEEGSGGLTRDYARALEWYRRAAEQDYAAACYSVGWYYDRGRVVKEDPVIAARWYRRAALAGDAKAANHLAIAYDEGRGVREDKEEAFRWYRISADRGNAAAMYNLAICCRDGEGTQTDLSQALLWARMAMDCGSQRAPALIDAIIKMIRDAAENGDPQAALTLARTYEKGWDTAPDEEESLFWYRLAAEYGEPSSLNYLGERCRMRGDKQEAFAFFEKAAAADSGDGMYNLALCYAGAGGVQKDLYQAREWAEKAGRRGSDAAHALLLDLRQQIAAREKEKEELAAALCTEADAAAREGRSAQAVRQWGRAAETGSLEALERLTRFYLGDTFGTGGGQQGAEHVDLQQAGRFGRQAWDAGIDLSGELFAGSAAAMNVEESRFWAARAAQDPEEEKKILKKAAEKAYEEALTLQLEKKFSAAFEKFRYAAGLGHSKAKYHAGRLCRSGMGTAKDPETAKIWLLQAYEDGVDTSYELFELAMEREDYEDAVLWAGRYEERHEDKRPGRILLEKAGQIFDLGMADMEKQKEKAAFSKFALAGKLGFSEALYNAGLMHLYGRGTAKNPERAADCFMQAGEAGNLEAKEAYVRLFYEDGAEGLDAAKAFAWLRDVIAAAQPGDTFSLGNYFFENEKDHSWRISWQVLEKTEEEILAISEYGIDAVPWQTSSGQAVWANSDLRRWLNEDFLQFAFSPEEAALLATVPVETKDNPDYGTAGSPVCMDTVSLLSMEEAMRCFTPAGKAVSRHLVEDPDLVASLEAEGIQEAVWYDPAGLAAMTGATPFALMRGAEKDAETEGCSWWLRSPGRGSKDDETSYAACVMAAGEIYSLGDRTDSVKALRPVIRIRVRSLAGA